MEMMEQRDSIEELQQVTKEESTQEIAVNRKKPLATELKELKKNLTDHFTSNAEVGKLRWEKSMLYNTYTMTKKCGELKTSLLSRQLKKCEAENRELVEKISAVVEKRSTETQAVLMNARTDFEKKVRDLKQEHKAKMSSIVERKDKRYEERLLAVMTEKDEQMNQQLKEKDLEFKDRLAEVAKERDLEAEKKLKEKDQKFEMKWEMLFKSKDIECECKEKEDDYEQRLALMAGEKYEKIAALNQHKDQIIAELKEVTEKLETETKEKRAYHKKVDALKNANKEANVELELSEGRYNELVAKLQDQNVEIEILQRKCEDLESQSLDEISRKLEEDVQQKFDKCHQINRKLEEKVQTEVKLRQNYQRKVARLKRKKDETKIELPRVIIQNVEQSSQINNLENKCLELESQFEKFVEHLKAVGLERDGLKKINAELEEKSEGMNALLSRNSSLDTITLEKEELEKKISEMTLQLETLQKDLVNESASHEDTESRLKNLENDPVQTEKTSEGKIKSDSDYASEDASAYESDFDTSECSSSQSPSCVDDEADDNQRTENVDIDEDVTDDELSEGEDECALECMMSEDEEDEGIVFNLDNPTVCLPEDNSVNDISVEEEEGYVSSFGQPKSSTPRESVISEKNGMMEAVTSFLHLEKQTKIEQSQLSLKNLPKIEQSQLSLKNLPKIEQSQLSLKNLPKIEPFQPSLMKSPVEDKDLPKKAENNMKSSSGTKIIALEEASLTAFNNSGDVSDYEIDFADLDVDDILGAL